MDALAGAGEPAGVDHRHETAQEFQIEHRTATLENQLVVSLSFNFQMPRRKPRSRHGRSPKGKLPKETPMSLAPSVAVPRTRFNPLPLYIGLFCVLWSFAFVAGKIGV